MSIAVSDLIDRLKTAVPASGGTPSDAQYAQAISEAVSDFNNRATRLKTATINVVSGTASYALPADFVKLVGFVPLVVQGNVIVTDRLIPMSPANLLNERLGVEGDQLVIWPTPAYTLTRYLRYGAGFVATTVGADQVYAEMMEREAAIVMLLAKSLAWGYVADVTAGGITREQIGDVSIQRSDASASASSKAVDWDAKYETAIARYIGTRIVRG